MAAVKLPDGSVREVADGASVMTVAESIGRGLAKAAVAGKVDGKVVDLSHKIGAGQHDLQIITEKDPEALNVLRHSTAHVMAEAIQRLWPKPPAISPNSSSRCTKARAERSPLRACAIVCTMSFTGLRKK